MITSCVQSYNKILFTLTIYQATVHRRADIIGLSDSNIDASLEHYISTGMTLCY